MPGTDTIAALSSASGASAVGIIRVSGPQAISIVSSMCTEAQLGESEGFCALPATLELPGAGRVSFDLYVFRAPNSYTTEDVAELHLPGSAVLAEKVLLALAGMGARIAAPGEFTRRAYLGGRIDLIQAEAVSLVISARSSAELAAAERTLEGSLSRGLSVAETRLGDVLAKLEASIDFSDQDIEIVTPEETVREIREAAGIIEAFAQPEPPPARDRLKILLCGRTNVGKSSLFNRLISKERVITSALPGTTRDLVGAVMEIEGTELLLLDSAGQKEADDEVEKLALHAMQSCVKKADAVVLVIEAGKPPMDAELEFFEGIEAPKLLVANKSDLGISLTLPECHVTSCVTGEGVERFKKRLRRLALEEMGRFPDALALSVRQRDALSRSLEALARALAAGGEELIAEDLREAVGAIGEITGETATEEILDRIFEQFCIGK